LEWGLSLNDRARRAVLFGSLALACLLVLTGCSACAALGFDDYYDTSGRTPPQRTEEATKPPAASADDATPANEDPAEDDTEGDISVVWTRKSGSARTDPFGLLNATPFQEDLHGLIAAKTVDFKPNSPGAKSAKGRYVYVLKLHPTDRKKYEYTGYLTLDWTMTIDRGPQSKNQFHSVYKADVTAMYDPTTKTITDGVAKGTAKTTDTFISGSAKMPHKTSADFVWTFATK
jgi:hypothetical protein